MGLPPMVGREKKKAFSRIKDQISKKKAGWKGKLLSNADREVLIKAVTQATPTYTMNCFMLPDSLCSEINSLVGSFWWGKKEKVRKIAWVSWENLSIRGSTTLPRTPIISLNTLYLYLFFFFFFFLLSSFSFYFSFFLLLPFFLLWHLLLFLFSI